MKSHTIELTRSIERTLPGGEIESWPAGGRYTVDDATAKALSTPTTEKREINGAVEEVEVPPAAIIVATYEIETSEEKAVREAEEKAAAQAAPSPHTVPADETEVLELPAEE